jgi:hypothetical protein
MMEYDTIGIVEWKLSLTNLVMLATMIEKTLCFPITLQPSFFYQDVLDRYW